MKKRLQKRVSLDSVPPGVCPWWRRYKSWRSPFDPPRHVLGHRRARASNPHRFKHGRAYVYRFKNMRCSITTATLTGRRLREIRIIKKRLGE